MGKRFNLNEKENNGTETFLQHLERRAHQSLQKRRDLLLLQKIRARMQESRSNMAKLRENLQKIKRCIVNCAELANATVELVEQENQESIDFLQQMGPRTADLSQRSRRTVTPMIGGLPLKRATISLRKLSADRIVHFHEDIPVPVVTVQMAEETLLSLDNQFTLSSDSESDSDDDLPSDPSESSNQSDLPTVE